MINEKILEFYIRVYVMPGLHSHRGYSSRLSRNCEWDKVRTNVGIHTLVRELWGRYNSQKSRDNQKLAQLHSSTFFTQLQTTIYIRELNKNLITVPSITRRDILVSFDSGLTYRHVSESLETRQEQVKNMIDDKCTLHILILVLCCLNENVNQAYYVVLCISQNAALPFLFHGVVKIGGYGKSQNYYQSI